MPLSDYLFDQSNIDSAVHSLENLIQNINNYTIPNITNTFSIINTSSFKINELLSNINNEIIPRLIETHQNVQISLQLFNELIHTLIITMYIFSVLFIIITLTYLYSKCCKQNPPKSNQFKSKQL